MSFGDPGIFALIIKNLMRKRGYRFASREIDKLTKHKVDIDTIERRRQSTPLKFEMTYRTNDPYSFKGGWSARWRELGEADATDGACRSLLFLNDAYDIGWFGIILQRKKQGWENATLTNDFDRLHRRFSGRQGPAAIS